jgi:hypothetical protein
MTLVEIVDVALAELNAEQLQGRNIEVPKTGSWIDSDAIRVAGWVLGRRSPAVAVEVVHVGTVLQSAELDVQRPDVADAFPEVSGAEQSGFRTGVIVPDTGESELLVQAVLQDESRVPPGVIRAGQRRSVEEQYSESTVKDQPGPLMRFFRRVLGRGGG